MNLLLVIVPMRRVFAILLLLVSCRTMASEIEGGKKTYADRCAFCHGNGGRGDGPAGAALHPNPPDFTRPEFWLSASRDRMRAVIADGKRGTAMLGFGGSLKPEEIDALLSFLETFRPR